MSFGCGERVRTATRQRRICVSSAVASDVAIDVRHAGVIRVQGRVEKHEVVVELPGGFIALQERVESAAALFGQGAVAEIVHKTIELSAVDCGGH